MSPFWRIARFPVSFDLPCTLKQSRRREGGQIVGPENELPLPLIKTGCGLQGSVDWRCTTEKNDCAKFMMRTCIDLTKFNKRLVKCVVQKETLVNGCGGFRDKKGESSASLGKYVWKQPARTWKFCTYVVPSTWLCADVAAFEICLAVFSSWMSLVFTFRLSIEKMRE